MHTTKEERLGAFIYIHGNYPCLLCKKKYSSRHMPIAVSSFYIICCYPKALELNTVLITDVTQATIRPVTPATNTHNKFPLILFGI